MASQTTMTEMDKGQYQQIQAVIEQNPMVSGFDLYYLGFLSYYSSQLTLDNIFTHVRNIINLHSDGLITNEEKIEFFLRIVSKKVDFRELPALTGNAVEADTETKRILGDYFSQIMKVIPQYTNISPFELFYLGRFHAICPNHKIAELFQHINNINVLVSEDLIDEETQIDFLLKILNKKIKTNKGGGHVLNIPRDQEIRARDMFNVKNEEGDSRQEKPAEKIQSNPDEQSSRHEESKEGRSGREDRSDNKGKDRSDRNSDPNVKKTKKSKGEREATEDLNKENHTHQKYTREAREDFEGKREGVNKVSTDGTKVTKTTSLNEGNGVKGESGDDRNQTEVRKGVSRYDSYTMKDDPNKLINKKKQGNVSKQVDLVIRPNDPQNRDNYRTMEEEVAKAFEDDENSKSNDSTSVDSGDLKITRYTKSSKMISNLVIPAQALVAVGEGGVFGGLANYGDVFNGRDTAIEEENPIETRRERVRRAKTKTIYGLEELLKRVRNEFYEGEVENDSPYRKGFPIGDMLPPIDSIRESQASFASQKPLLVEWKKRRSLALREEDESDYSDNRILSHLSEEEEHEVKTKDPSPVELGKRTGVITHVKESRKKVKVENSHYEASKKDQSHELSKECKAGKLEITREKIKEENKSKMSIEKEKEKSVDEKKNEMEEEIKKTERKGPKMKIAYPAGSRKPSTPYFGNESNDEGQVVKKTSKKSYKDFGEDSVNEEDYKRKNVKIERESKEKARMKVQKERNERSESRSRSRSNDDD